MRTDNGRQSDNVESVDLQDHAQFGTLRVATNLKSGKILEITPDDIVQKCQPVISAHFMSKALPPLAQESVLKAATSIGDPSCAQLVESFNKHAQGLGLQVDFSIDGISPEMAVFRRTDASALMKATLPKP